ncbi:unnamed protein product [Enterobius vermicularis]|uniref:CCHC-type domain-containing protein n=1 Tax=Enterobius vermicularis TaxID=51028 RepID=A0A0N4VBK2_ENTVE|nr:unnamed protein product [Enterobius vermicularis]
MDDITSWLARFDFFVSISLIDEDHKEFYLLNSLSSVVYRALAAFVKPQEITSLLYKNLKLRVTEMYGTKTLLFSERYHFFHLKQEAKSYLEFATLIREKAAFCELGDFYVPALALVFTVGINDPQLREKFLEIENCTLEQALAIAQKKEQITTEATRIKASGFIQSTQITTAQSSNNTTSLPQIATVAQYGPCLTCGGSHKRQNCKFREAECYNCHRKGHIAKVCRARSATARGQKFKSNNNSPHTAASPQNKSNPACGASRQKTSKKQVNQVLENPKTGLFFVTL